MGLCLYKKYDLKLDIGVTFYFLCNISLFIIRTFSNTIGEYISIYLSIYLSIYINF